MIQQAAGACVALATHGVVVVPQDVAQGPRRKCPRTVLAVPGVLTHTGCVMPSLLDQVRLDRKAVSIGDVDEQTAEYRKAALALSAEERLQTVEFLRQVYYGPNLATERVQRVLEVLERGGS